MTIVDVARVSGLFDRLNEQNKEVAFAYARGMLDSQIMQEKRAPDGKDATVR